MDLEVYLFGLSIIYPYISLFLVSTASILPVLYFDSISTYRVVTRSVLIASSLPSLAKPSRVLLILLSPRVNVSESACWSLSLLIEKTTFSGV